MTQDSMPLLYHAHHSRHPEDLSFWRELAGGLPGPLLELGCGTGRVLLDLAGAGHRAYGLDHHPGMLRVLRSRLTPELARRVYFWQGDLTAFRVARRFGLILMPCNTFSTLDSADRRAALRRSRSHLLPGGLFAASLPNPRLLRALPAYSAPELEETFPHPLSGEPVRVSGGWEREARQLTFVWDYETPLPEGGRQRLTARTRHFLDGLPIYLQDFQAAGFQKPELYGDFDRSPYTADSNYLIVVAAPRFGN